MEAACDIYEFAEHVPWWDPVQLKLSTLPLDIPAAADLALPAKMRKGLNLSWGPPEATRVYVHGGSVRSFTRIEIGHWTTPHNYAEEPRYEGVRWASGSKSDLANDPYWAEWNEADPHTGVWTPGDYLWIEFIYGYVRGDPAGAQGYSGPEGVRFLQNDPLISTSAISAVQISAETTWWDTIRGWVVEEEWHAEIEVMSCHVRLRIDPVGKAPPGDGYTPAQWWDLVLNDSDIVINWEVIGRQMETEQLHELSAQAWDASLMDTFGDVMREVRNEALLVSGAERAAVEAESQRQLAMILAQRNPASLELESQDLRLLPGDCLQTRHPRDAYDVLVWLWQMRQKWSGGKATTGMSGYVVGTV